MFSNIATFNLKHVWHTYSIVVMPYFFLYGRNKKKGREGIKGYKRVPYFCHTFAILIFLYGLGVRCVVRPHVSVTDLGLRILTSVFFSFFRRDSVSRITDPRLQ